MNAPIDLDPILALPVQHRIGIVQIILDSIAGEFPRPPLSEEFKAELRRRAAEDDANPDGGVPWEVVQAEALARIQPPSK